MILSTDKLWFGDHTLLFSCSIGGVGPGKITAGWSSGKIPFSDGLDLASYAWCRVGARTDEEDTPYPVVNFS